MLKHKNLLKNKISILLSIAYLFLLGGNLAPAFGQTIVFHNSPDSPKTLLDEARVLADEALFTYMGSEYNIDQVLWQEALAKAEAALAQDPNNPEILGFIADVYNTLSWESRTREYWLRYLEAGGARTDKALSQLTAALNELGFNRYETEDWQGALTYYKEANLISPNNPDALVYLARIYFEQGDHAQAQPYWEQAAALGLNGADYFLARNQQRLNVGIAASDAFYLAQEAYEAGDIAAAWESFVAATAANDNFVEAWVWRGRTALETQKAKDAVNAWQRVKQLNPDDPRADYFVSIAERQVKWGAEAGQAFTDGISAYEQGNFDKALEMFQAATTANDDYVEAWVWQARVLQETDQTAAAVDAWQTVLAKNPADERAKYFLGVAKASLPSDAPLGENVKIDLATGISYYEAGDLITSEKVFQKWVETNPGSSEGWGWLGRIAFDQKQYTTAAQNYENALEQEPDNETFKFFAQEAKRLSAESNQETEQTTGE